MANLLTTIRTGFYSFLTTDSSNFKTGILQTVSSVAYYKLFNHIAPSKIAGVDLTLPYVVFDLLPLTTNRDSASKYFEGSCQFRISANTIGEAETLSGYLIDVLEDSESSLTFTNYNLIRIDKEPIVSLGQIDGLYNIVVPYLITIGQ